MTCDRCGNEIKDVCYQLRVVSAVSFYEKNFCGRRCVIENVAPELKQAVVIEQWVPTTREEIDRMSQ